jgi:GUN4-like/NACHT domain
MPSEIEPQQSEQESSEIQPVKSESGMSAWKVQLGGALWQWMAAGGMSIGSLVTVLNTTDLPKIALGGAVGGGLSGAAAIVYAAANPVGKRAKKLAEEAGNTAANAMEDAAKKQWTDRPFEERYWDAQALECQSAKSTGIPQYDGIFVSLLEKVFVELGLDGNAQMAGYGRAELEELARGEEGDRLQIWDLLKRAERKSEFGRMALLAWGGYGKTTLMRHVAYVYSKNQQRRGLARKIPVLIILGRYRELLSGPDAPDLARFVETHHIPDLPGGKDLTVPENWAQGVLQAGRAVVMLDGFDEVPKALRVGLVGWMNEQTRRYPKSIFILTSRPRSYREQDPETFAFPTAYWVQEFDDGQRRDFIDRWYLCQEVYAHGGEENAAVQLTAQRGADDLYGQIERRQELKDMAKNPLLLTMMTTFHRRNNGADLPRRRVELYQEICRLQLKDRPGARKLETSLLNCNAQEILQALALEMMQGQSRLMKKDLVLANLRATLTAKSERIDGLDFLEQVTDVGELLIRQEDEYEFSHLSFQEYLAAMEIVRTQQEPLLYEHLRSSGEFADSWSRLMLLYVGLVNPTTLIRKAIKQGRGDLADRMYQETTKQIDDPALKAELERGLKQEVKASKYAKLEAMLKAKQWRDADEETYRVMIQVVGKEVGQGFDRQDLENFPCEDLLMIDGLWKGASNRHFGFSVQKKIWEKCGSPMSYNDDYKKFMTEVGWRRGDELVSYSNLKFSLLYSLEGELPVSSNYVLIDDFREVFWVSFIAQRFVNCSACQSIPLNPPS